MAVAKTILNPHKEALAAMMIRRHWIVHRADHNEGAAGPGRHRTRYIGAHAVRTWKDTVAVFCSTLLNELERS
jgi:hypothetical protein